MPRSLEGFAVAPVEELVAVSWDEGFVIEVDFLAGYLELLVAGCTLFVSNEQDIVQEDRSVAVGDVKCLAPNLVDVGLGAENIQPYDMNDSPEENGDGAVGCICVPAADQNSVPGG